MTNLAKLTERILAEEAEVSYVSGELRKMCGTKNPRGRDLKARLKSANGRLATARRRLREAQEKEAQRCS